LEETDEILWRNIGRVRVRSNTITERMWRRDGRTKGEGLGIVGEGA